MPMEIRSLNFRQPALFDFASPSSGALELFPSVWGALEDLASPQASLRRTGLERLVELNAHRLSPLVAYMLVTRIDDPDLTLRSRIIRVLGDALVPDAQGSVASESVVNTLASALSQMHTHEIYAVLQVSNASAENESPVARLLNACPYAGNHLADILADRKAPLSIRKQAVNYIGLVGFLDAIPGLERLQARLEARLNGQQSMPFLAPLPADEVELLPAIETALAALRLR